MRHLVFLLFTITASFVHADERDALVERLKIADRTPGRVGVYRRYASGRHRLVVVATNVNFDKGVTLLIRLPDADRGKGKVVDRDDLEAGGESVSFLRLVGPKDVGVEHSSKHSVEGKIYRVMGESLVEISNSYADAATTPDLDGDGIPEIVWRGYGAHSSCGWGIDGGVLHWNGKSYVPDGKHYVFAMPAAGGATFDQYEFHIPPNDGQPPPEHYRLRVHRGSGVQSVRVLIDDEAIAANQVITLEEDCHTLDVKVSGSRGAVAWVFLEERPRHTRRPIPIDDDIMMLHG